MRPHTLRTGSLAAFLAVSALLAFAAPGQAIYIETPLTLSPDRDHAEIGEDVDFDIAPNPNNDSYQPQWAGKKIHVRYSFDQNEGGEDPEAPVSDAGYIERDLLRDLLLDGNASGRFTWTVPAEVQDRNVNVFLEDDTGERLAFAYLAIGNATPMMHILASSSGMEDGAAGDDGTGGETTGADDGAPASREAPAFGVIVLMVVLAASAIGLTMIMRRV